MEGGNEKIKKTTTKKSTSSKKTKDVRKSLELTNEQLLDEILNKKKTKKSSSKKTTKSTTTSKKSSSTKRVNKLSDPSNDLLYEQLKQKKKNKKSSGKTIFEAELEYEIEEAKLRKKELSENNEEIEKVLVNENNVSDVDSKTVDKDSSKIVEDKDVKKDIDEYYSKNEEIEIHVEKEVNSLEESVKRKKEQHDDFTEFLTEIENDKLLRDIKKALANNQVEYIKPGYEQSKEEALKKIDNEINERIKNNVNKETPKKKRFSLKLKFKLKIKRKTLLFIVSIAFFLLLSLSLIASVKVFFSNGIRSGVEDDVANEINSSKLEQELLDKYNQCLDRELDEFDQNDSITEYVNQLNEYFDDTYKISILYKELGTGYTYGYRVDQTYYAASTIKSLGAIYLYEKAYLGEVNLDDTMTYTKKYRMGASAYMKEISYGTNVSLRDLVKYSITASDNTAHKMIVDYIGVSTLKEYGKSLGATLTHLNNDLFGYINVNDAYIYMNKLNELILESGELGQELRSYFVNDDQNGLDFKELDIEAAHKYGQYENIYHDIGIVYDEHPYIITILTNHGRGDFVNIIRDINGRVNQLHDLYINNRKNYCENLVYEK